MTALTRFPSRVRFVNPDGTLTTEAARMLDMLFLRVGGALGDTGTDLFVAPDDADDSGGANLLALADHAHGPGDAEVIAAAEERAPCACVEVAQPADELGALELLMQPAQLAVDQVDGLGTMAAQDVGTNFTGSFTGKTVTVSNGIITTVA
jgi:hypothetical protein